MKKNLFTLLIASLLLIGCDSKQEIPADINNDVSTNENVNSNEENNNNTNNDNGGTNQQNNDNNQQNNNDNQQNNDNNQSINEYKVTFQTYGDPFKGVVTKRSQFSGDANNVDNVNKLKNYLSSGLMYDDCLTNLTFGGYVQALDAEADVIYLCLGSGSNFGEMTWNSTRKILKVEVTVKNYYKSYSYGTVSGLTCDNLAHFQIDETDYSLEIADGVTPESKTFSKTYGDEGTNSFKISSVLTDTPRVLVESICVTWKL